MTKLMIMSALAGAILITTATTSCKKGDQGPAGANRVAGKDASPLELAQLKYNDAKRTNDDAQKLDITSTIKNVDRKTAESWVSYKDLTDQLAEITALVSFDEQNTAKAALALVKTPAEIAALTKTLSTVYTEAQYKTETLKLTAAVDSATEAYKGSGLIPANLAAKNNAVQALADHTKIKSVSVDEYNKMIVDYKTYVTVAGSNAPAIAGDSVLDPVSAADEVKNYVHAKIALTAKLAHEKTVAAKTHTGNKAALLKEHALKKASIFGDDKKEISEEVNKHTLNFLTQAEAKAKLEAAKKELDALIAKR